MHASVRESSLTGRALSLAVALTLAVAPMTAHAQGVVYSTAPPPSAVQEQTAPPPSGPPPQYSAPRTITDYDEGDPIPRGYHPVEHVRKGLIVGGAVTFGVLYFLSLLVAAGNTDYANRNNTTSQTDALYIPAIGPFVQMTKSSATANVFLAIDGIAQTGGLIMLVGGIAAPKTVLVRDEAMRTPRLMASPIFGPRMQGMGIVGTF